MGWASRIEEIIKGFKSTRLDSDRSLLGKNRYEEMDALKETLKQDTHDIVLVGIGSLGFIKQETPDYFLKLVQSFPHKSFKIYLIDDLLYSAKNLFFAPEFLVKDAKNCEPVKTDKNRYSHNESFTEDQFKYSTLRHKQYKNLEIELFSTKIPTHFSFIDYIQNKDQNSFAMIFKDFIVRKLNEGKVIFIGDHTGGLPDLADIRVIAHVYKEIKNSAVIKNKVNLQLYTQCGGRDWLVYDPQELTCWNPIKATLIPSDTRYFITNDLGFPHEIEIRDKFLSPQERFFNFYWGKPSPIVYTVQEHDGNLTVVDVN